MKNKLRKEKEWMRKIYRNKRKSGYVVLRSVLKRMINGIRSPNSEEIEWI